MRSLSAFDPHLPTKRAQQGFLGVGWLLVLPLLCTQRRKNPLMLSRLKISLSVPKQGAGCHRGWRPRPGPCVVSVEETELAHLARTHPQAKGPGAGFHSSCSPQGEIPECQEALEWMLPEPLLGKQGCCPRFGARVLRRASERCAPGAAIRG